MDVLALGCNFRTTPVEVREKLAQYGLSLRGD